MTHESTKAEEVNHLPELLRVAAVVGRQLQMYHLGTHLYVFYYVHWTACGMLG